MRRSAPLVPLVAVGALVTACGSTSATGSGSGASTTPPAPVTQQTVTDTVEPPTSQSSAPSGGGRCATSALTVSLGSPQGAAGSEIYPLHLANGGSTSCTIGGYPGVSYVAPGNGIQVGPAATRVAADGGAVRTVTLAPGAEATTLVRATSYQDYPTATCAPTAVSGLRVYPPGNTASAYVAFTSPQQACSKIGTLQVQPLVAGDTGS